MLKYSFSQTSSSFIYIIILSNSIMYSRPFIVFRLQFNYIELLKCQNLKFVVLCLVREHGFLVNNTGIYQYLDEGL